MSYIARVNKKLLGEMSQCLDAYLSGQSTLWLTKFWSSLHKKADEYSEGSAADGIGKYITILLAQKVSGKYEDLELRSIINDFLKFIVGSLKDVADAHIPDLDLEYEVYRIVICTSIESGILESPKIDTENGGSVAVIMWGMRESSVTIKLNKVSANLEVTSADKQAEIPVKFPVMISTITALLESCVD